MRISRIEIIVLSVPLKHPYYLSKEYGIFSVATPLLAKVCTDEGITGFGECDPWPLITGDSAESAALVLEKHICPALLGQDPTNINEIHSTMDRIIRNQHIAKSAIDMAAYDIIGKAYGMPVHKLLGGKRMDTVPCMWSVGGSTPEETAQEVLKAKDEGYFGCMIKIGGSDYRLDAMRTCAARDAVGNSYPLIVDANQGWDVDTAIRYYNMIKTCDILFFEQPVQSWDVEGLAKIRRKIDIPLSADESVVSIHDARKLVEADAVDIFSIKVTKNGGIKPAKNICDFADANGIQILFNSMIEEGITQAASINLCSTCSNLVTSMGHAFFSPNRLESDICNYHELIKPELGSVMVPDQPGLGVEVDDSLVKRYNIVSHSV